MRQKPRKQANGISSFNEHIEYHEIEIITPKRNFWRKTTLSHSDSIEEQVS